MYQTGKQIKWSWGNGYGNGKITQIYKEKITKTIDGSEITRNGSEDNPAYLIEQKDGDQVLKLHSEVEAA